MRILTDNNGEQYRVDNEWPVPGRRCDLCRQRCLNTMWVFAEHEHADNAYCSIECCYDQIRQWYSQRDK